MREFCFADLGRVHWPSTLKLVVGRSFFSGLVLSVPVLLWHVSHASLHLGAVDVLMIPFLWVVLGPLLSLSIWATGLAMGSVEKLGLAGAALAVLGACATLISSTLMCLGDPIVYWLNRHYPWLFRVANFRFLNVCPLVFVTFPE